MIKCKVKGMTVMTSMHDRACMLQSLQWKRGCTFVWKGATASGVDPMYSLFTGSYRPMRKPPNRHCLCKPAQRSQSGSHVRPWLDSVCQ